MKIENIDWEKAMIPVIEKYHNKKHPLDYNNIYQLMIMVLLAAQTTDEIVNKIAPQFFKKFPNIKSLAKSSVEEIAEHLSGIRNFYNKATWIFEIAQTIEDEKNIPKNLDDLVALKGLGRKSANVILREAEVEAEGIVCDLHVIRVAGRLGIADENADGNKVEKQLMAVLPKKIWGDVGISLSFLGREICRPTNPKQNDCPLNQVCEYCLKNNKS